MDLREINNKLLDISPIGILILNVGGEITYANQAAEQILSLSKKETVPETYSTPAWKITTPAGESLPYNQFSFAWVLQSREKFSNVEQIIEKPDGSKMYLSINSSALIDEENRVNGAVVTIQNLTDKLLAEQELRKSEKRYQDLFDNLIDEVHIWKVVRDKDGSIQSWQLVDANSAALRNWGKTKQQVIGQNAIELFGEESIRIFKPIVEHIFKTNSPCRWEVKFPPTNQYLSMDSIPLGEYFISTGNDITDRINASEELLRAKENAEQSKEKALQNELRLKQTHSLAKLGGWEYDLASGLFYFNDNFFQIFRSSVDKVGGYEMTARQYADRFVHPDDRDVVANEIAKAVDTPDPDFSAYLEHRMLYDDGDIGFIAVRYYVIKDKQGRTTKLYGVNQDITDRKLIEEELVKAKEKAEESEANLLEAQALSHVGSWEYLNETDTVTWSKELFNIFERSDQLPAPRYSEQKPFYTPESFERLDKAVLDCVERGIPYDIELDIITANGTIKQIISKGQIKEDKNKRIIGCYGTAQDITKQKKLEADLVNAKVRAEESDQLKTAFLQNLSHEIRTPLNAICGFSQILEKQDLTDSVRKNYLALIKSNSMQLLSIVSDVLAASALEKGQERVNIKKTNINILLTELFSVFKSKAVSQNIQFRYQLALDNNAAIIETDETKVRQIVTNLLNNAFKFTPGGEIEFGYRLVENNLEFFVRDTGIGIRPEMHKGIFERFRQADPTISRKYGGNGLGLSISNGYVELLGGKMWLESELDKGSTFYFSLPYNSIQTEEIKNGEGIFTILVAEDEIINFMVIQGLLMNLRARLIHARDGQEAIDLFRANPSINLILMDIKMPVLNGDIAAKEIKSIKPDVPIIAQSGYTLENEKAKYKAIFDDYITKPLDDGILTKIVSKYVSLHKA